MLLAVGNQGRQGAHIVEELDEVRPIFLELPDAQVVPCTCEGRSRTSALLSNASCPRRTSQWLPAFIENNTAYDIWKDVQSTTGALHCKA